MPEPVAKKKVLTRMRYDASKKLFEYKADENVQVMEIPEANIGPLVAMVKTAGGDKMAEVIEFLINNSRQKPGQWIEASSAPNEPGQAAL